MQHRELALLASEIAPLLEVERLAGESIAIRLKLSKFTRKLRVHQVVEDRFIYEHLLGHSDPAIVTQATEHQRAAHSLRDRVARYGREWISTRVALGDAGNKFIEETKSLFELVFKRFDFEDRELYPLVEQICNRSGVWPVDLTAETDDTSKTG